MTSGVDDPLRRRPPPPIPLVVLTGFLGSGKTTLLNRWVHSPAFAEAAVIINEFGEIGLDHMLVEKTDGTVLTLSSGCLCCTIRGDLIATLEDLVRRRDNGRVAPFTRVIIETTGLADPAPILNTIMFHPYLPMRYRLDSVVTVVDALHGLGTIAAHDEARRQVAVADTLILTKTDLLQSRSDAELRAVLAALNPVAPVLDAARDEATSDVVATAGLFDLDRRSDAVRAWLNPARYAALHPHHDHAHDVNRHDAHIAACCLTSDAPLDRTAFQMFLDLLRGTHGAQLLRMKGLVLFRDDPRHPFVIHGVQHYVHPAHRLERWPDDDQRSRMVFITRDLAPGVIKALWDGFFGTPSLDRPDGPGLMAAHEGSAGLFDLAPARHG